MKSGIAWSPAARYVSAHNVRQQHTRESHAEGYDLPPNRWIVHFLTLLLKALTTYAQKQHSWTVSADNRLPLPDNCLLHGHGWWWRIQERQVHRSAWFSMPYQYQIALSLIHISLLLIPSLYDTKIKNCTFPINLYSCPNRTMLLTLSQNDSMIFEKYQ